MKAEDIRKSHPQFQKYPLGDFKRYNKNMKNLVNAEEMRVTPEDAIFLEDTQHHPQKQITCRGTPFWSNHAAKKMLIKDVEDGIGQTIMPRQLWESRVEYQAFPYDYFCKRVYEVRQKGLAGPYWQVKRNKNGRELHRLETDEMRKKWALNGEMEEMTDMFKRGM
jgi:hypothetical protein